MHCILFEEQYQPGKIRSTETIDHNHKNPHDGFGNKVNYDYACVGM